MSKTLRIENSIQAELDFYSAIDVQFGHGNLKKIVNPYFEEPRYRDYFGKSSKEVNSLKIPISVFPIACKCPSFFEQGIMPDGTFKFGHHKSPRVFQVGSLLDKYARRFVASLHSDRARFQGTLKAELELELLSLYKPNLLGGQPFALHTWSDEQVSSYVKAFDNFCDVFKNARLAELPEAKDSLEFKVQSVTFSGKVDLLLKSKNEGKYILIDLKLQKFDDDLSSFRFEDHVQVFVYAHILLKRGINLDFVGYYYFVENTLILNSISPESTKIIKSIVEKLCYYITRTIDFVPRKCELCLICPLKSKCRIGKELGPSDYKNPLGYF